jgi:hypothetical protein
VPGNVFLLCIAHAGYERRDLVVPLYSPADGGEASVIYG